MPLLFYHADFLHLKKQASLAVADRSIPISSISASQQSIQRFSHVGRCLYSVQAVTGY
jgi:hypothetical protein